MDTSYQLSTDEHDSIYSNAIEPANFFGVSPVASPRIIIIGGQTGAGKSNVVKMSKREFADENVVLVNTDDIRAFHPQFEEIIKLDDKRSAERTHLDAADWSRKLLERCIETRRNILWEGVFKDTKSLLEKLKLLRENGYEIVFRCVAAHRRYSVWGIARRYEKEKISRGHGRYVPLSYHDECYQNFLTTLDSIEEQRAVDRIEVFSREGVLLFSNEIQKGDWTSKIGARAALETERNRTLSAEEEKHYKSNWQRVFEYMKKRDASAEEFDSIKKLYEECISDFSQ